jgi:hypothetical protein
VSADPPDLPGPPDPSLERLFRALTADGSADELAGRPAALAMFRDSRRRPRRRFYFSMSTAAAAVVLAGGIAAAYAAVLPAPVQHVAYRMLAGIGVPDTHHPSPSASAGPGGTVSPSAAPSSVPPSAAPSASTGQHLVLVAAHARVPADGGDEFSGRLTRGGRAEPGVSVQLFERVGARPGWQAAGTAVTDPKGDVTLTVGQLTSNASFRLTAPGGTASPPVVITVIPPVYLIPAPGQRAGTDTLTAYAPFADPGDAVVLQELSRGGWRSIAERSLDRGHLASFTVRIPRSGGREYRVVIRKTSSHGRSVSRPVWVGTPPGPVLPPAQPRPTKTDRSAPP